MIKWLRVFLGVMLILIPEPTMITDALGVLIIAGAIFPGGIGLGHSLGCCRCYHCTTGLDHPVTI